jgi:EAL domain-containing protein (putative c-di-GMP-specific phosphodiesterase class I)
VLPIFLTASYASPDYQRQLAFNALKINQSFVIPMTSNPDDATIVRAVIRIG